MSVLLGKAIAFHSDVRGQIMRYITNNNHKKNLMKRRHLILLTLCISAVLSGCAKSSDGNEDNSETASQYNTDSSNKDTYQDFTPPEPEIIYEDADITLPAGIVAGEISDENISDIDEDTASVTYSLSGSERGEAINQISKEIEESISMILGDKDYYPNITSITPNENYTEFTITLSDENMNVYESMLLMSFYIAGDKYQIYNGVSSEDAVTVVRYVNSATGAVISETDSTSMKTAN